MYGAWILLVRYRTGPIIYFL